MENVCDRIYSDIVKLMLKGYKEHLHFSKYLPCLNQDFPLYLFSYKGKTILVIYDTHHLVNVPKILRDFLNSFGERSVIIIEGSERTKSIEDIIRKNKTDVVEILPIIKIPNFETRRENLRKIIEENSKRYDNIAIVLGAAHQVELESILNKLFKTEFMIPKETRELLSKKLEEVYLAHKSE